MSGYNTFKSALVTKLTNLEESVGVNLFVDVKKGAGAKLSGYPSATIFNKGGSGQIMDTHNNQREWQFSIFLVHQFNETVTQEVAEDTLDAVVDKVLSSFDTDQDLSGMCDFIKVVPVSFDYVILQEPFIFAELVVGVVDMVNRR